MTFEEAITTAIEYETRIRDLYNAASGETVDAKGKSIFSLLAEDEQRHVDYLNHRLAQLKESGKVTVERLDSVIPDAAAMQSSLAELAQQALRDDRGMERQMLSRALQMEVETSAFYRKLTGEMDGDAAKMFGRFLEIEDNHVAAVQAELDYITKTGYWFGFKEFDME